VKDENCSNNEAEPKESFKVRKDIQLLQILKDHELQKPVRGLVGDNNHKKRKGGRKGR